MLKQAEKGGKDFMLTEVQCGLLSAREIDGFRRSAKDMQFPAILLLVHQLENFCRQLDGLFFDGFGGAVSHLSFSIKKIPNWHSTIKLDNSLIPLHRRAKSSLGQSLSQIM